MPVENSVGSQFDRKLPLRRPAALLSLMAGVLLPLCFVASHRLQSGIAPALRFTSMGRRIDPAVPSSLVYGVAGLVAFLFLYTILRIVETLIGILSGHQPEAGPALKSVEQFIAEASLLHIDPKIATEAYRLFEVRFPDGISFGLNDDLRSRLAMQEQDILSMAYTLPERCNRQYRVADAAAILTVYDLLAHIESATLRESGQHAARGTSPSSPAQAPISPLAGLQNASPRDSRFRTRAHFSGVKRRASDYSGPYRRSTDRPQDAPHTGPLRRASDRQGSDIAGSPADSFADRRENSSQRSGDPGQRNRDIAQRNSPGDEARSRPSFSDSPSFSDPGQPAPLPDSSLTQQSPDTPPVRRPSTAPSDPDKQPGIGDSSR